jgi:hypothetical protein
LPFVKVVRVACGETFSAPGANGGDINSVTKHGVSKIDSLFITFHNNRRAKVICIHPYIENFRLTVEEAGYNSYPGGGIKMNTWND